MTVRIALSAALGVCLLLSAGRPAEAQELVAYLLPIDNSAGLADPDFPPDVQTFDIVVEIAGQCYGGDNDWQTAELHIVFNGAMVYHHPLGPGIHPPDAALFAEHPGLAFDTYVCAADADLADSAPQADQVWNWQETNHEFTVSWIDLEDTGNGVWRIGRVSLVSCRPEPVTWYELCVTSACTGAYPECFGDLAPAPCPGDLDGDGDVDLGDLDLLLASYGQDAGGDQDCDGVIDLEDLADLLANYGCQP